ALTALPALVALVALAALVAGLLAVRALALVAAGALTLVTALVSPGLVGAGPVLSGAGALGTAGRFPLVPLGGQVGQVQLRLTAGGAGPAAASRRTAGLSSRGARSRGRRRALRRRVVLRRCRVLGRRSVLGGRSVLRRRSVLGRCCVPLLPACRSLVAGGGAVTGGPDSSHQIALAHLGGAADPELCGNFLQLCDAQRGQGLAAARGGRAFGHEVPSLDTARPRSVRLEMSPDRTPEWNRSRRRITKDAAWRRRRGDQVTDESWRTCEPTIDLSPWTALGR